VAAALPQNESAWLFDPQETYRVLLRPVSLPQVQTLGLEPDAMDAGQTLLPHAGMGTAGGGAIPVRPDEGQGRLTDRPQFLVHVRPVPTERWTPTPGERVHLRFRLSPKPLAAQWADRLRKLIQGRVQL
jgi:hypothetical protein